MDVYKRIILKLSGEALAGGKHNGFDLDLCMSVANQVKKLVADGTEVGIVIGGGNFWRGRNSEAIDRTKADQIGMLATVMNCIYVSEVFRNAGLETAIFTPFSCGSMTKLFSKDEALSCLKKGAVIFLAGGTGHPYFTTDTGTVLRAVELECDIILMAKNEDGVYDSDPKLNPNAAKYDEISMQEIIDKRLGVVDMTAAILSLENSMPMILFRLTGDDSIIKAVKGQSKGTRIVIN